MTEARAGAAAAVADAPRRGSVRPGGRCRTGVAGLRRLECRGALHDRCSPARPSWRSSTSSPSGGSAVVAILAAWAINLRMVLYSASLAPYLGHEPTRRRLGSRLSPRRPGLRPVGQPLGRRRPDRRAACRSTWAPGRSCGPHGWRRPSSAPSVGGAVPDDGAARLRRAPGVPRPAGPGPGRPAASPPPSPAEPRRCVAAEAGAGPLSTIVGAAAGIAAGAAGRRPARSRRRHERDLAVIVVSGAGTYAMRASFLGLRPSHGHGAARRWRRVLRQNPAGGAGGHRRCLRSSAPRATSTCSSHSCWPALVAALVAWRTRNVGVTRDRRDGPPCRASAAVTRYGRRQMASIVRARGLTKRYPGVTGSRCRRPRHPRRPGRAGRRQRRGQDHALPPAARA